MVSTHYHSTSTRIRLKNVGQIKDKKNNTIGMKMDPSYQEQIRSSHETYDFELYFESGIDNEGSWLKVMKEHKLVKQGGYGILWMTTMVMRLSSNQKIIRVS